MIYLIGWLAAYFLISVGYFWKSKRKAIAAISLVPFLLIACLRGGVGTDTEVYRYYMDVLDSGGLVVLEPGFVFVSYVLTKLIDDPDLAVNGLALVYFLMLAIYLKRSNENEVALLVLYILPAFSYAYSMNVIRVGLASAVFLLASQMIKNSKQVTRILYGAASALFHYSAIVYVLLSLVAVGGVLRKSTMRALAGIVPLSIFMLVYLDSYLEDKADLYIQSYSPSVLSGAVPSAVISVILMATMADRLGQKTKLKILLLSLLGLIGGYVLSRYSYAGLRVLNLISFGIPVCITVLYNISGLTMGRRMKFGLLLAGVMSAVGAYMNYKGSEGVGLTPFLPYKFYWD